MSTRRTRSSSRQSSVRGGTPNVADITITPARRRSKSAANTGRALPSVNAKHSTAYGTNTTSAPGSLINTKETKVGSVFQTILEADEAREVEIEAVGGSNHPDLPQRRPSRRGNSVLSTQSGPSAPGQTPQPPPSTGDKSFVNESGVFQEVEVETSSISSPSPDPAPYPTIYEEDEEEEDEIYNPPNRESTLRELEELERQKQREIEEREAREARERAKASSGKPQLASKLISDIPSPTQLWQSLPSISFRTFLMPFLILGVLYLAYSFSPDDIGYSIGGYVGKYIPSNGRGSFFTDKHVKELKDLRNRFKGLESQIATIEKQPHLTPDSIKYLESSIPDFVVVKKDRRGNLQIPTDFWKALHSKIRGDTQLFPPNHDKDQSSKKDINIREWDRFLDNNKAKVKTWVHDEIDKEFSNNFQDRLKTAFNGDAIISRSEMIRLMKLNWADTTLDVKSELKELRNTITPLAQHEKRITNVEKTVLSLESRFKALQLQALSQAHLNGKVNWGLRRVNHFSTATGARIDIRHTSPNYVAPINDRNVLVKTYFHLRNNPLPVPNGPEEALKDWDAYGDCWCSPAGNVNGWGGASLGVFTGNAIYPDQVIIEHVPRPASLAPGAAPRDMELLAFIDDPVIYRAATAISTAIFPEDGSSPHGLLPPGYVRLAKWTFDGEFPNPVQAFDVQIRLGEVDKWTGVGLDKNIYRESATSRLIVRAINNWGVDGVPEYTCLYRVRVHGDTSGEHSPFDGKL